MAKNETRRLSPKVISEDVDSISALAEVVGYAPVNTVYSLDAAQALLKQMQESKAKEVQAEAAFRAAKDQATTKEWDFHNMVLGVKDQVRAQFGKDSDELQSIGLKKKVDYKSPK